MTEKVRWADLWISLFKYVGSLCRQIRMDDDLRYEYELVNTSEVIDTLLPRKTSKENICRPYRKPTQVGEERILRRMR